MITGERQATRIRGLYLETILRQDIEFFDTETNTGEVIGRMSGDTILIQDAMGEKVRLHSFSRNVSQLLLRIHLFAMLFMDHGIKGSAGHLPCEKKIYFW